MYTRDVRNVVLVAAANGAIAGKRIRKLWPDEIVFRYCSECVFLDSKRRVMAADPDAWIERMRDGFDGAWLHGRPRWLIEAVRSGGSEVWEGSEQFGDGDNPDKRIWRSGYRRIAARWHKPRPAPRRLPELMQALDKTLADAALFARAEKLDNFARCFEDGRAALHGKPADDPLFTLADFSIEAQQLWSAIGPAWVFGGMGSWNDIGFDGVAGEQYARLSDALSEQLNSAIAAVANSTYPCQEER